MRAGLPLVWALAGGAALVMALALPGSVAAQDDDPHVGTWILNVQKSKFSQGPKAKEHTVVWTTEGDGYKVVSNATDASGPHAMEYTVSFDGTDKPAPGYDGVAGKRVDDRTIAVTFKKGGAVVLTETMVLSNYGKTRTDTVAGTTADGTPVQSVLVFEKKVAADKAAPKDVDASGYPPTR